MEGGGELRVKGKIALYEVSMCRSVFRKEIKKYSYVRVRVPYL